MNRQIQKRTLLNSLGVVVYVALVATLMMNGEKIFGREDTILTGVTFLLLFSMSAAIVGSLVFGYPVLLFLNGHKKESITALMMTIGWLALELILVVVAAALISR